MVRKAFVKGTILVLILVLINYMINPVLMVKTGHRSKLIQGLYEEKGKAYDVVFLGSSHMNGAINPNELWGKYGITGFNFATGGEPIDVTYYLLKEIMKNHDKPLVVVDLYYLGLTGEFGEEGYVRYVMDSMKLSLNKIDAVIHCTPRPLWASYLVPVMKYHSRWNELTQYDFEKDKSAYYEKGFVAERDPFGHDTTVINATEEKGQLPPKSAYYLNKIIELSKKDGFKLVFMNAPYDYTVTNQSGNWVMEPKKMFNKVAEISKQNNIPFINYCDKFDDLNFDFKADMFNAGHLNVTGANKVTDNLGKFLKDEYKLTDHRGDKAYDRWQKDYTYYVQMEDANDLKNQSRLETYMPILKDTNYSLVISGEVNNAESLRKIISNYGTDIKDLGSRTVSIIEDGKVKVIKLGDGKQSYSGKIAGNQFLETDSGEKGKYPSIQIDNKEYAGKHNGINIVVYDKVLKTVVDSVYVTNNKIIRN